MQNPFTSHPRSVGETYYEHLRHASGFGFKMIGAGIACLLHALLPFLFEYTGSNTIFKLAKILAKRRGETDQSPRPGFPLGEG